MQCLSMLVNGTFIGVNDFLARFLLHFPRRMLSRNTFWCFQSQMRVSQCESLPYEGEWCIHRCQRILGAFSTAFSTQYAAQKYLLMVPIKIRISGAKFDLSDGKWCSEWHRRLSYSNDFLVHFLWHLPHRMLPRNISCASNRKMHISRCESLSLCW